MTEKQVVECGLVQRMFVARGLEGFTFEPSDRPDVIATGNGHRIGIEVTVFHGDEGQNSNRGSIQRKTEEQINRNLGGQRPYARWAVVDPVPALIASIRNKVVKAKHYRAESFNELWLLIASSLPQLGAMVSTYILSLAVNLEELNNHTHDLLGNSPYAKAYLHLETVNGLYEWSHLTRWRVLQAPREVTRVPWSRFKEIISNLEWLNDPRGKARAEAMKALEELRAMQQN